MKKSFTKRINSILAMVLTIVALAAGQSAWAETVTYGIDGTAEPNSNGTVIVNLNITASGSATGTASKTWDYISTQSISDMSLPGDIKLSFGSDKTSSLLVKDNILGIKANGSTGGYITLSHASKYIYHVTLKDRSGNVIHEAWNMTKSYEYRFQSIEIKFIVVEYAAAIPITDAVISGINASYPVSNAAVKPTPTVTWHGTMLTKDTHYTISYQNNTSAGTATVMANGKGIFSTSTNKSANYTLVWATYTVRFNKNNDGASGTMSNQAFTYNTAQNLTANAFTRTGYAFAGWNTATDGTGTSYTDGQSVSNLTITNGATVNLYAQWTPTTYNITYDLAGGTINSSYPTTYNIETATFTLANPVRTGYTFAGWTGSNGNTPETTVTISQGSMNDRSYTANWTPVWGQNNGADGTSEAKAYIITTPAGLDLLAKNVNGTDGYTANTFSGTFFQLGGDIDYTPSTSWNDATSTENNFTAIGNNDNVFCGTFDGDGHTISGIRIYEPNNKYQGLFGKVTGGTVKNVTVSDARITGDLYVAGIAGKTGASSTHIESCFILNTAITAQGDGGVLVGYKDDGTFSLNFYHNCIVKVGSDTYTTNIGLGTPRNDYAGEVGSVHTLTLPANVTATGESVEIDGIAYYAKRNTVTLAYTGTLPAGCQVFYTYNDGSDHNISGNTFTMPASNVTVSASVAMSVSYLDADGNTQNVVAMPLTGAETTLGTGDETTWYVVSSDISFDHEVTLYGDVHLILSDGKMMAMTETDDNKNCIWGYDNADLTIFGQSAGTGALTMTSENDGALGTRGNLTINGGHITATAKYDAIYTINNITINGGVINATSQSQNGIISSHPDFPTNCNITINGGIVSATGAADDIYALNHVTLGYRNATDYIAFGRSGCEASHVSIASGKTMTDGTAAYSGRLSYEQAVALGGKTLRPCFLLTLPSGVTASGMGIIHQNSSCYAVPGTTVTLNCSESYVISSASYNDGSDHTIDGNTFTMPAAAVTVSVTCTISWDTDGDGTVDETTTEAYGTAAEDIVKPADPTKAYDGTYFYEFAGWTPALAKVTGDATYTASYTAIAPAAAIGGTPYPTIQAAVDAAAEAGDLIVILRDVDFGHTKEGTTKEGTTSVTVDGKAVEVDLAGFEITGEYAAGRVFLVKNGAVLTISDSSAGQTGAITALRYSGTSAAVQVYESDGQQQGNSKVIIEGGSLQGYTYAVNACDDSEVEVNGGVLSVTGSGNSALWLTGMDVTCTVNGGTITGTGYGISAYIYANLTINGGTIASTSANQAAVKISNGCSVDIADGDFSGPYALHDTSTQQATVSITGGKFSGSTDLFYPNDSGRWTATLSGGIYSADPSDRTGVEIADDYAVVENNDPDTKYVYPYAVVQMYTVTFVDDGNNATEIANISENYGGMANVTLTGRTLWKDGDWNTLCLPFNATLTDDLEGATLMELDVTSKFRMDNEQWTKDNDNGTYQTGFDATTGTLYLFFKPATSIVAGTPYIIKWAASDPDHIDNPIFNSVTIDNGDEAIARMTVGSADGKVSFIGNYDPVNFEANDKTKLFLGSGSTLYYPSDAMTVNAFRAYFQLTDPSAQVKSFVLNFGEERPTLVSLPSGREAAGAWYTLDGRKVQAPSLGEGRGGLPQEGRGGLPSGIYIHNGRKVVIK